MRKTRAQLTTENADLQDTIDALKLKLSDEHDKYRQLHRASRDMLEEILYKQPLASVALKLKAAVDRLDG